MQWSAMTKCDSLFTAMRDKCYYKVWQVLLQSATACSLQCATSVITKCDKCYYKVWQVLLQNMTSVITKCDKCYNKLWQVLLQSVTSVVKKVWQVLLQSVTSVITKCDRKLSHLPLFLIPEFIFFALNFFQVSPSASVRRAIHNPPHLLGHSAESKC